LRYNSRSRNFSRCKYMSSSVSAISWSSADGGADPATAVICSFFFCLSLFLPNIYRVCVCMCVCVRGLYYL
jgi:hypothetical protein